MAADSATLANSKKSQVGATFEERANYVNGYLFFNHLLDNHIFYELRGYYIHNLITTAQSGSLPPTSNQQNLNGAGGVGILGYNIQINSAIILMPFTRLQYLTNTVAAYKDTLGNEIDSDSFTTYLGLKLAMKINDVFSIFAQYFAGYQITNLYGKGFYASNNSPKIDAITSTAEIDFPYKITRSWIFTPYIQWVITGSYPNSAAFAAPMRQSGTTVTTPVYALRLAYAF